MKWDLNKVLKNPDIAIRQQFGADGDTAAAWQLKRAKAEAYAAIESSGKMYVASYATVKRTYGDIEVTQ